MNDWVREYYDEVDSLDAAAVAARFTDDGTFRLGNLPVAAGRAEIAASNQVFFDSIAGMRHDFTRRYTHGDVEIVEADVTYEMAGGAAVTIPGIAVLECIDGRISRSRSYIDPAPLETLMAGRTRAIEPRELVTRFIAAVDTLEIDRMIPFFTPDATFTYGNNPPMVGHAGIRAGLEPIHASLAAISHVVTNCFPSGPNVVVAEYAATYTRPDGRTVTLPGIGVFELSDGLISAYRVYADVAPVFGPAE